MGYFLTKLAAKAEENERTVGGTLGGAAKGIIGAGALGGAAYGGAKGLTALHDTLANRATTKMKDFGKNMKRDVEDLVTKMTRQGKSKGEIDEALKSLSAKKRKQYNKLMGAQDKNALRGMYANDAAEAMKRFAKKNWKWGVPAAIAAGGIGGGLLLND